MWSITAQLNMPNQDATPSGIQILIDWANEQDNWVRLIVTSVLAIKRELPTPFIEAAYKVFLGDVGVPGETPTTIPKIGKGDAVTDSQDDFRLISLNNVSGVNNLATSQEIAFNPHLTLLFGENAAGKTGYVRVLKRASSIRGTEQVLGNVYTLPTIDPSATIRFKIGDVEDTINWKNETGIPPLTRVSVFDTSAVAVHLDEDLTYSFTPEELALFRYSHVGLDAVKAKLIRALEEASLGPNPFINRILPDGLVYPKISSLNYASNLSDFEKLATLSPDEETQLRDTRKRVIELQSPTTDDRIRLVNVDIEILKRAQIITRTIKEFPWKQYNSQIISLRQVQEKHELLSKTAFANNNIPGLLGAMWHTLIQSAEAYLRETHTSVNALNDPCPYCRQPLNNKALELVQKYHEYNNGKSKQLLDIELQKQKLIISGLSGLTPEATKDKCSARFTSGGVDGGLTTILPHIIGFMSAVENAQSNVSSGQPFVADSINADATRLDIELTAEIDRLEILIGTLRGKNVAQKKLLQEEITKLRTLDNRIALQTMLPLISARIEAERWVATTSEFLERQFPPLLRSLTERTKEASAQLLDQNFGRLFEEECRALRAPSVSLDFSGIRGEAARTKIIVPERRPSEILSEGEQRVLALADFLAEVSLRGCSSPIVFDDPVNSLDHKRIHEIADRLIRLSEEHQVIIFTHNILLVMEVVSILESDTSGLTCYTVEELNGQVGIITSGTPRLDTLSTLKTRINQCIEEAAPISGSSRAQKIEEAYECLRAWIEVFVESDLLANVTKRYSPMVSVTSLDRIKIDRLSAAMEILRPLYDKSCRHIVSHSQPTVTLGDRPTLDELRADWLAIQKMRKDYID